MEKDIKSLFLSNVAQVVGNPSALVVYRAEGNYLYDQEGTPYLDFISGISVANTGHGHPTIISSVINQVKRHMHVMVYGEFAIEPQAKLATKTLEKLHPCMNRVYFVNSGTEAIEASMKISKKYTGRSQFISFKNSYHGSTQGSLSIQGSNKYKGGYYPLLPDTHQANFNDLAVLEQITTKTAGVVIECIQAGSGYIPANQEWIKAVRARCTEVGALMILDEIQTGMGRTGNWFAHLDYGFCPDIMCLAKAYGGGLPLGAFVAPEHIMKVIQADPILGHITTFGGNPVSCAASLGVFEVLEEDVTLMESIPYKEQIIQSKLIHPNIEKISGKGLMYCLWLKPAIDGFKVIAKLEKQGVISNSFLFAENAIRITPPLTITMDQLNFGLNTILEVIDDLSE
ncbi:MAG: aspartate aminotransferase family protein [Flavobacteriales bacterium]|nr:aspartate aminotransferase family protein [Flavobacteriales bacterium]|tara:strand:- start:10861 stop:12057 length:1197 start_codon:yes stop_codon:yes gene_type:complete